MFLGRLYILHFQAILPASEFSARQCFDDKARHTADGKIKRGQLKYIIPFCYGYSIKPYDETLQEVYDALGIGADARIDFPTFWSVLKRLEQNLDVS